MASKTSAFTHQMIRGAAVSARAFNPRPDSHLIEAILYRNNPVQHATALSAMNGDDRVLNAAIAKRFHAVLRPTRRVNSMNVRGRVSSNQEWQ